MPLLCGGLTVLVVFAALALGMLGLFASGGGLIIVSVTAHAAGTAVATALASRSRREPRLWFPVVTAAVTAALLMLATTASAYHLLTYAARQVFGSMGGLVLCLGIGYIVAEWAAGRVEPTWSQYARPLALATVAVVSTLISWLMSVQ